MFNWFKKKPALKPSSRLRSVTLSVTGPPSEMSGVKFDNGKPPLGLIPRQALEAEARVMAFGAEKYGRDNWRGGMDWSRLTDAALRHITAFVDGEDLDPETGLPHLAHARCCMAFLLAYGALELGQDDRHHQRTVKENPDAAEDLLAFAGDCGIRYTE